MPTGFNTLSISTSFPDGAQGDCCYPVAPRTRSADPLPEHPADPTSPCPPPPGPSPRSLHELRSFEAQLERSETIMGKSEPDRDSSDPGSFQGRVKTALTKAKNLVLRKGASQA